MDVAVLGPVRLVRDEQQIELGRPKQRALLAALALAGGRPVTPDALVDLLWGAGAPPAVSASLQAYVSGLRRLLEPDRPARSPATVLVTTSAGYALRLPAGALDAARFTETVERVRRRLVLSGDDLPLPPVELGAPELGSLEQDCRCALALWGGEPYADLRDADEVVAERARLAALRLVAQEDLALVRLARGEHAAVAAELDVLTREHPLRESLRALHVLALAGEGRQADALEALRRARHVLADELGVDPGPALQALETAVLRQDPRLRRTAAPAAAVVVASRPAPVAPAPDDLPRLVGRSAELAVVEEVLRAAEQGRPASALLVGEPGVGKSRLLAAAADRARAAGFAVLSGRCSGDEGAPPLWPWTGVLRDLADELPLEELSTGRDLAPVRLLLAGGAAGDGSGAADGDRFTTGDALVGVLAAAAEVRPLLVVLDDLHWADASSLRLLGQVVEDLPASRVAVVTTRRPQVPPTGPLAQVSEVLVRAGTRRVEVGGLSPDEVAELVELTTARPPDDGQVRDLHDRTAGNALFVLELLRLGPAGSREVPAGVRDVVTARVAQLPGGTQDLLQTAAVLGRSFDLDLLAAVAGSDDGEVLDRLEPASSAGIVVEEGVARFRFSHALVAEAVSQQLGATRRARRHASAAAALEQGRGTAGSERLAETARHWLAAGPSYAGRAWRAAAAAAEQAVSLHAHEEAAALLGTALEALDADPGATAGQRYDLLLARADACRWSADRVGVDAALHAAVVTARAQGDTRAVVRAAADGVEGILWMPRAYGTVDPGMVDALREGLRALPPQDSPLRCRAQLALAAELYYTPLVAEREALAEEGLAAARRIGDPALLGWACAVASAALWRPARLRTRVELADEALTVAEQLGDLTRVAYARTTRAIALQEVGEVGAMREEVERARTLCEQLRLAYPLAVLGWLEVPWLALQGRFEEAEALHERCTALAARTSIPDQMEGTAGSLLSLRLAQGRVAETLPVLQSLSGASKVPMQTTVVAVLARAGLLAEARAAYDAGGLPLGGDDWARPLMLALAAQAALLVGLPVEGAEVYDELSPFAGFAACGGSGASLGPVDVYLACAAAAAGRPAVAVRHAEDALALCERWDLPVLAQWLTEQRDRFGF